MSGQINSAIFVLLAWNPFKKKEIFIFVANCIPERVYKYLHAYLLGWKTYHLISARVPNCDILWGWSIHEMKMDLITRKRHFSFVNFSTWYDMSGMVLKFPKFDYMYLFILCEPLKICMVTWRGRIHSYRISDTFVPPCSLF